MNEWKVAAATLRGGVHEMANYYQGDHEPAAQPFDFDDKQEAEERKEQRNLPN